VVAKLNALLGGLPIRPATSSDRRFAVILWSCLAAFCGAFVVYYYSRASGLIDHTGHLIGRDFVVFWNASVLTLGGQVAKVFDQGQFHSVHEQFVGGTYPLHPWLYPPHTLLYGLPLGLLPYLWSYALWSVVTLALYLAAAYRRRLAGVGTLALILAPATFVNFLAGQNGFLSAALLIAGMRLIDRRPVLAGILLGLLCFKPQLGILVPVALVAARLWRPFLSASITVLVVVALSIVVLGLETWQTYLGQIAANQSLMFERGSGLFVLMMPTPLMATRILGLGDVAGYGVQAFFSLCAILGVYTTFRKRADRSLQVAVLLVGVFLMTPYGFNYDMTLTSVAVLWGFERAVKTGFLPGEMLLLALVWALPVLVIGVNAQDLPVAPVILGLLFLVLVIRANGWLPQQGLAPAAREAGGAALPQPSEDSP
jgi:hypothetical protein